MYLFYSNYQIFPNVSSVSRIESVDFYYASNFKGLRIGRGDVSGLCSGLTSYFENRVQVVSRIKIRFVRCMLKHFSINI